MPEVFETLIPFLVNAAVLVTVILLAKRQAIRSLEATHAQNMADADAQFAALTARIDAERAKTRAALAAPVGVPDTDEERSRGKLVAESEYRPPIVVDCSQWATEPVRLELTLTLRPDTDAATVNRIFDKLTTLVKLLGDMEIGNGGKGLRLDAERSGVRPGPAVGLVLVPNDPTGAGERLRTLAQVLSTAASEFPDKQAVVVRVVSAEAGEEYKVAA